MVNIYTLFYAACIPVIGKLADIRGRKPVFIGCLLVFMAGSLICGLSQTLDSFPVLLAGPLGTSRWRLRHYSRSERRNRGDVPSRKEGHGARQPPLLPVSRTSLVPP